MTSQVDKNLLIDIFYLPVKPAKVRKPRMDKGFVTRQIRGLRYMFENIIDSISDERSTDDGVWFYLKNGYSVDGVHCVHEWSNAEAMVQLRRAKKCNCVDCQNL